MAFNFPLLNNVSNYIEKKIFQMEPEYEEKFATQEEFIRAAIQSALDIQDEHLTELTSKHNSKKFRNEYYTNSLLKCAVDWRSYVLSDFTIETTSDRVKTSICKFASKLSETDILDYEVAVKVLKNLIKEVSINDDIQGYNLGLLTIDPNPDAKYKIGFFSFLDKSFTISRDRKTITIPQYYYTNINNDDTYSFEVIDKRTLPTSHFLWYSSNGSRFNVINVSKVRAAIEPAYYYSKVLSFGAKAFGNLANTPMVVTKKDLSKVGVPLKVTNGEKMQKANEVGLVMQGKMNCLVDTEEWEYKRTETFSIAQTNLANFAEVYIASVANAFMMPKELLNAERKDINASLVPAIKTWGNSSINVDRANIEIFIYQLLNRMMIEDHLIPKERIFKVKWTDLLQSAAAIIPTMSKDESKNVVEKEVVGRDGKPVTYKTEEKSTITKPVESYIPR